MGGTAELQADVVTGILQVVRVQPGVGVCVPPRWPDGGLCPPSGGPVGSCVPLSRGS